MVVRKTLVKSEAGVRLERIERLSAQGRVLQETFRLSTLRPAPPRLLACAEAAENAFDVEVIASLCDPVVSRLTL